jgi:hypothetical protein
LANSPPDTQQREEILVRSWDEFDEESAVHWKVTTHTKADKGDEDAESREVWGSAGSETEDASDEESSVPRDFSATHTISEKLY